MGLFIRVAGDAHDIQNYFTEFLTGLVANNGCSSCALQASLTASGRRVLLLIARFRPVRDPKRGSVLCSVGSASTVH